MPIIEPEDFRLNKLSQLEEKGIAPFGRRLDGTVSIASARSMFDPEDT